MKPARLIRKAIIPENNSISIGSGSIRQKQINYLMMKHTYYTYTNIFKNNFINMCGLPSTNLPWFIIPFNLNYIR
jgi:hypothetical protein